MTTSTQPSQRDNYLTYPEPNWDKMAQGKPDVTPDMVDPQSLGEQVESALEDVRWVEASHRMAEALRGARSRYTK